MFSQREHVVLDTMPRVLRRTVISEAKCLKLKHGLYM